MNFQCTTEDTVVATEQGKYRGYQFRDIYQFRGNGSLFTFNAGADCGASG